MAILLNNIRNIVNIDNLQVHNDLVDLLFSQYLSVEHTVPFCEGYPVQISLLGVTSQPEKVEMRTTDIDYLDILIIASLPP